MRSSSNKRGRRFGPKVAVLASLLVLTAPLSARAESQADLDRLRQTIQELQSSLAQRSGEKDRLAQRLAAAERAIGEATREAEALTERMTAQEKRLAALAEQRTALRDQSTAQRHALGQELRALYLLQQQGALQVLLSQSDPAEAGRAMGYYRYLTQARAGELAAIRTDLEALARLEADIRTEQATLARLRTARAAERQRLTRELARRNEALAALEAAMASDQDRLAQAKEEAQQLEAVLQRLEEAAPPPVAGATGFAAQQGRLAWPSEGELRHRYGEARSSGLRWRGVLIDAESGADVRAVAAGRVVFSDWLRGFGLLVIVDHGDGYMSLYGHNQALYKDVGDPVQAGETIGSAGSSGGLNRPGVYFELRRGGEPMDPLRWCVAPNGQRVGWQGE